MTTFTFQPNAGVLPIRFGMSVGEVTAILGSPSRVVRNFLGERDERRDQVHIRYGLEDEKVVEISVLPSAALLVEGEDVLRSSDPIQFFRQLDPHPVEWVGFVIFLSIGIALTGYHDGEVSQRAATAFVLGRWDDYRDQFTAFRG